ncbi:MAG: hypothetical protein ACTHMM_21195 [Agriterribacter sp.]
MDTRLYIEGQEVDLSEGIEIPLTYSIQDIKDISKTSSSFSKTVTIPGTTNNNKLFNFLFDIKVVGSPVPDNDTANIGQYFDFKKKARCYVVQNNMVVMQGYAKLLSSSKKDGHVTYQVQLISELTDFVSVLSDKKLEDISQSLTEQYTHRADFDTIFDSWEIGDTDPATSFIYPLADYGQFDTVAATNFYLSNLRPALFAKQYLNLIFENAGFTFTSDFLDSQYFKRLVIPYCDGEFVGKGLESVVLAGDCDPDYQFSAQASQSGYDNAIAGLDLFGCVQTGDEYYSASGMTYTATATSVYDVSITVPSVYYYFTAVENNFLWNTELRFYVSYVVHAPDYSTSVVKTSYYKQYQPGDIMKLYGATPTPGSWTSDSQEIQVPTQSIELQEGEHLQVTFYLASKYPNSQIILEAVGNDHISGSTTVHTTPSAPLPQLKIGLSKNFDNARVTYADFCLKGIKQIDFVASIFKLFNLIPIPDESRPRHFNIITADQYYNNEAEPLDWTDKIDYSQEVTVMPIPSLSDGALRLSYKEDSDYWSTQYKALTGKVYGEATTQTGFEWASSTKEVLDKIIFSPTPAIKYRNEPIPCETTCEILNSNKSRISISGYRDISGQILPTDNTFAHARVGVKIFYSGDTYEIIVVENPLSFIVDRDVVRSGGAVDGTYYAKADTFYYITENDKEIIALYESSDNNVTRKPKKVNPRIVYYQGMKECNRYVVQLTPLLINRSYNYVNSSYLRYKEEYPVFSHVDNNVNPTRDLLFARPNPFYGDIQNYPDSNSENFSNLSKNWENTFAEITQNEAKMLTAWVKLNAVDIANLDMTRRVAINGTYCRINAIKDYLPRANSLTLCEFVRCPDLVRYPVPPPPPYPSCRAYRCYNYSTLQSQTIQYYDCEGVLQSITITPHNEVTFCAYEDTVVKTPYVSLDDDGECGSVFYCRSFSIENEGETPVELTYLDCNEEERIVTINAGITKVLCAMQESFEYEGSLTIEELGECLPPCTQYELTNTSDTFGLTATYKDCDNELQIKHVNAGFNAFICALEGTVEVSAPELLVEETGGSCSFGQAVLKVYNNSGGTGTVTNARVSVFGNSGGTFPVSEGGSTAVTTTNLGSRTVTVILNKDDAARSVTVIGSDGVSQCQNVTGSGAETLDFPGVAVWGWGDVQIFYNAEPCT